MPDSMYDKLGKLLSKAIESGDFFVQDKDSGTSGAARPKDVNTSTQEKPAQKKTSKHSAETAYKNKRYSKNGRSDTEPSSHKLVDYAIPETRKAFAVIGVELGASYGEAKRQFHKKLMRFHPDKNADNETMRKITREKTGEVLKAWKIVEEWYKNQK